MGAQTKPLKYENAKRCGEVRRIHQICLKFTLGLWLLPFTASAEISETVKNAFGLFAIQPPLRHRFEGYEQKGTSLDLNLWYEDASVTKTGQPTDSVFCRIAHILTQGRHKDPTRQTRLPLDVVYSEMASLSEVRLNFFAVMYTNKPLPPEWAQKPGIQSSGPDDAKLRVVWTREEKVIPYLSYSISRDEWKSLASLLRPLGPMTFENFQSKACSDVLRIAPHLRANFKDIQLVLNQTRIGAPPQ